VHWQYLKGGLSAVYYEELDFSGRTVERTEPEINFSWKYGRKQIQEFTKNSYSVIWKGVLVPDITVDGLFGITTDDSGPAKLYVDDKLIIDSTSGQNPTKFSFVANKEYSIRFEFIKRPQPSDHQQSLALTWNLVGENGIRDAAEAAKDVDVVIVAVGEDDVTCGEGHDRNDLFFPGKQHELVQALVESGKPVVMILLNGRPLSLQWENDHVNSIIEAFYPGQSQGLALAEVLFGLYNPAVDFP